MFRKNKLYFFILYIFSKYAHSKLRHHPSKTATLAGGRVFKTLDFACWGEFEKIRKNSETYFESTYFENKRDSLPGFWAMNQEASEPLPPPVPAPGSVGMLARCESPGVSQRFPWARSAYGG